MKHQDVVEKSKNSALSMSTMSVGVADSSSWQHVDWIFCSMTSHTFFWCCNSTSCNSQWGKERKCKSSEAQIAARVYNMYLQVLHRNLVSGRHSNTYGHGKGRQWQYHVLHDLTCSTLVSLDNRSIHFLCWVGTTNETASERQAHASNDGGTVTKEESVSRREREREREGGGRRGTPLIW